MTLQDADKIFGARKYADALEAYKRIAETAPNQQVQVEALAQVARCISLTGKLDDGRPSLEKAAKLASKDEPLGWSRLLGVRGIFERESGDKAKAKATFEEMYAYCEEKTLHRRAVDAVHHIAIVAPVEEQPSWALKGIAAAEKVGDDGGLAVLWNNLGATYEELKQFDKCLDAYLKARDYHRKSGDEQQRMIADWAVGHAYRLAGKTPEARELLEKTLALATKRNDVEWLGWCKKDLGEATGNAALMREGRGHLVEAGIEQWWPEGLKLIDDAIGRIER